MISVIIPVYNSENYLRQTVESVLNQTLQPNEIIIIDDGSTDNSLDIIKKIKKQYSIIRVYSQDNIGPSITRNRGVCYAKYEWICFVDADDILHPQRLEVAMKFSKNCDVVICDFNRFNFEIKNLDKFYILKYVESLNFEDSNLSVLRWGYGLPRMLMKKAVYNKVGGLDSCLIHNEDHELHFRMLIERIRFKKINVPLYYYRQHKGEFRLSNQASKHLNIFNSLYKMAESIDDLPIYLRNYAKEQLANRIAHNALKAMFLGEKNLEIHIKFAKKMNHNIQPYNNKFFNLLSSFFGFGNLEKLIGKLNM